MDADAALVPLEERSIDFYGDALVAVLVEVDDRSQVYVPVRPLCAYLGLAWSGQYERIKRDPVLAEALRSVRVTRTEGGERGVVCLPLEYLPGWLFGISGSRVRPELQEKILRYRRECFRVLWEAFQDEAMVADGAGRGPERGGGTLVQIRDLGLAIARMAEQQMQPEQRVVAVDTRMDRAAAVVGDLRRRLGAVERRLEPGAPITDAQAAEVSARVKALAELLTGEDRAKNHYQAIFGELYRRYGVSSYKLIPQGRYEAVLGFLEKWRRAGGEGEAGVPRDPGGGEGTRAEG